MQLKSHHSEIMYKSITVLFSIIEIIGGLLLLIPTTQFVGIYIAITLYILATLVINYSLITNKEQQECGCFGDIIIEKVSVSKILKNLFTLIVFIISIFIETQMEIMGIIFAGILIGSKFILSYVNKYTILLR